MTVRVKFYGGGLDGQVATVPTRERALRMIDAYATMRDGGTGIIIGDDTAHSTPTIAGGAQVNTPVSQDEIDEHRYEEYEDERTYHEQMHPWEQTAGEDL